MAEISLWFARFAVTFLFGYFCYRMGRLSVWREYNRVFQKLFDKGKSDGAG